MQKLLSLVLSFTMIYMSMVPLYAQGVEADTARKSRDAMKMEACERDARGEIIYIDFDKAEHEQARIRMLNNPDGWEWRTCSYVVGLKKYYERHPGRTKGLSAWQRQNVYKALERFITRWNGGVKSNDEFRNEFIDLNALVMKGLPTRTAWQYHSGDRAFHKVADTSDLDKHIVEQNEAARGGAGSGNGTGGLFGVKGGSGQGVGGDEFYRELEMLYKLLTQDPQEKLAEASVVTGEDYEAFLAEEQEIGGVKEGDAALSYEEFKEIYRSSMEYEFAGQIEEQARQHEGAAGWNEWVEEETRKLYEKDLSERAVRADRKSVV